MVRVAEWSLRIFLALVFVAAGVDKFIGPMWVRVFNDIGVGQWFRYFTGVVELLGEVGVGTAVGDEGGLEHSWRFSLEVPHAIDHGHYNQCGHARALEEFL